MYDPFHWIGKMDYILMGLDITGRKLIRNIRKLHDCIGDMSIIRLKRLYVGTIKSQIFTNIWVPFGEKSVHSIYTLVAGFWKCPNLCIDISIELLTVHCANKYNFGTM